MFRACTHNAILPNLYFLLFFEKSTFAMINTKKELQYYLQEDAKALGYNKLSAFKRFIKIHFDKRVRFHIELRKYEYWSNVFSLGGVNTIVSPCFFIIIMYLKNYPILLDILFIKIALAPD